jgi:hypothetical protein
MNTSDLINRLRASAMVGADDFVHSIGLERRRTAGEKIITAVGVFGAGLLVGAGLGVLFAPKAGRELRSDIGASVNKVGEKARELGERVRGAVDERVNGTDGSNSVRHV